VSYGASSKVQLLTQPRQFMRRIILALSFLFVLVILIGADIRRNDSSTQVTSAPKKKCLGYTIIEFGKGIDCNGDTVKLVKVNGVQVLAESL
jgi:hypothetical protein